MPWKWSRKKPGVAEKPLVEVEKLPAERTWFQEVVPKKYGLQQILKESDINIKELIDSHMGLKKGEKKVFLKKAAKDALTQEELTKLVLTHPDALKPGKTRNGALKIIDEIFEKSKAKEDAYKALADLVLKGKCNERLVTEAWAAKILEARKMLMEKLPKDEAKIISKLLEEGKSVSEVISELRNMKDNTTKARIEAIKSALKQLDKERYDKLLEGLEKTDKELADEISKLVGALEVPWGRKSATYWGHVVGEAFKDFEIPARPSAREAIKILEKTGQREIELAYKMGIPEEELINAISELRAGSAKAKGVLATINRGLLSLWKFPLKAAGGTWSGAKKYPGVSLTLGALFVLGYLSYSSYIKSKSEEEKRKIEDDKLAVHLAEHGIIPIDKLSEQNRQFLEQNPRLWGWLNSKLAGGGQNSEEEVKKSEEVREYVEKESFLMSTLDQTLTLVRGIVSNHPTLKDMLATSVKVVLETPKNTQTSLINVPITYTVSPRAEVKNELKEKISPLATLLGELPKIAKWMEDWGIKADGKATVKEKLKGKNLDALSINDIIPLMQFMEPNEMAMYKKATDEEKREFDAATENMKAKQLVAMQLAGMSVQEWLAVNVGEIKDKNKANKLIENLNQLKENNTSIKEFIRKIEGRIMKSGIKARGGQKQSGRPAVKKPGKAKEEEEEGLLE